MDFFFKKTKKILPRVETDSRKFSMGNTPVPAGMENEMENGNGK